MHPLLKFLIEIGPLVVFFWVNGKYGIFEATAAFMAATVISMAASWLMRRTIPIMLWVSGVVVLVFGGATILFENELFIKLKPTIIYLLFAGVLFFGLWRGQSYLKLVLDASFPQLQDEGWMRMTRRWAWFFLAMAALNEVIWRAVDTDTWVAAKLFLFLPLSMVFAIAQVPLIQRYQRADETRAE